MLVNLFVTLQQSDSSVKEKMWNYQAEICKLLPRDRKNAVLYTVHRLQSNNQFYIQFPRLRWCSNELTIP